MASAASDAFISYSHEDIEFVDKLAADLRARGFNIWVDRRRLKPGQDWAREIESAITRFELFIIVMSPPAVNSDPVRDEYQTALRLGKQIVPVMWRNVAPPTALADRHYTDFEHKPYGLALKELIFACWEPSLDLDADSTILYDQALTLEDREPERSVILLQHILDTNPSYFGGKIASELKRVEQHLYPARVARLKEQAGQARQQGQYDIEAGALKAIIELGAQDKETYDWAQEYLKIAQENSAVLGPYEVIARHVAAGVGNRTDNAELLEEVWRHAPYFRDPVGVAPSLGLTVPMTYEEARERRQTDETRAKKERDATSERDDLNKQAQLQADSAVSTENERWRSACSLVQHVPHGDLPQGAESKLRGWSATSDELSDALADQCHQIASLKQQLAVAEGRAYNVKIAYHSLGAFGCLGWFAVYSLALLLVLLVAFGVDAVFCHFIQFGNWLDYGVFAVISISVAAVSLLWLGHFGVRARELKDALASEEQEAASLVSRWISGAEAEHSRRLSDIEDERQRLMGVAHGLFQRRMTEITIEYAQAVAVIAQRYRQG